MINVKRHTESCLILLHVLPPTITRSHRHFTPVKIIPRNMSVRCNFFIWFLCDMDEFVLFWKCEYWALLLCHAALLDIADTGARTCCNMWETFVWNIIEHTTFTTHVQVNCVWGLDWCSPIQTAPDILSLPRNCPSSSSESTAARCPYTIWQKSSGSAQVYRYALVDLRLENIQPFPSPDTGDASNTNKVEAYFTTSHPWLCYLSQPAPFATKC